MFIVAPLVGAWIEIGICIHPFQVFLVAPLVGAWIEIYLWENPSPSSSVAPLVGAWIEICYCVRINCLLNGRSSCRSVDWNIWIRFAVTMLLCRSSCRSVDWNPYILIMRIWCIRRSSCRSVDWNVIRSSYCNVSNVAPLVGAWIEIVCKKTLFFLPGSLLL